MSSSAEGGRAPGRPAGSDGAQTRKRIMLAAMAHVAERGYARATLKEIARDTGLTSGTIYHYFPSKVELVRTTYREVVGRVFPALETAAASAGTFPTMLTAMLEAALEAVAEYPDLAGFTTAVGVAGAEHPELGGLHEAAMGAQWRTVERLVERARQSGMLPTEVDSRAAGDMLFAILRGLTELSATVSPDRHRAAVRCTEQLLLGRLLAPDAGRSGR